MSTNPKISYLVNNRRRTERHSARVAVRHRKADSGKDFLLEYTHNISRHGIFIGTETPFEIGTRLDLVFCLSSEDSERLGKKNLHLAGTVAWTNPVRADKKDSNPGMGIQFENADEETLEVLGHIIHQVAVLSE